MFLLQVTKTLLGFGFDTGACPEGGEDVATFLVFLAFLTTAASVFGVAGVAVGTSAATSTTVVVLGVTL